MLVLVRRPHLENHCSTEMEQQRRKGNWKPDVKARGPAEGTQRRSYHLSERSERARIRPRAYLSEWVCLMD